MCSEGNGTIYFLQRKGRYRRTGPSTITWFVCLMWFGVFVVFFWAYRAWKASFSFSSSSACASTPLCCHSVQPGSSLQYPNEKKLVGKSWMESYINLQSSHGIAQWRGSGGVLKNKTSPRKLIYWVVSSYVNTVCMYKLKVYCVHMSVVLLNGASDGMPVVVFKTQFHIWVTAC